MSKRYIVKLDFGGTNYYLQFLPDGGANEIYNPHFATTYLSKAIALKDAKEKTTFGEYSKAVDAKEERDKFDKWFASGMIRRTFPPLSKVSRPYNGEDRAGVLDWHIEYRKLHAEGRDGEVKYDDYKTWQKLPSLFTHIYESCCQSKGRDSKPQPSFQMKVNADSDFKVFKEELDLIVDKIGTFEDGEKLINIFDHDLSAGGCPHFVIKPDGKYSIRYIRWGHWRDDTIEGTLEEVFEHWRKHNWYES